LAVIEAGSTAYVVSQGAVVAGDWTLAEINRDSVVLTSGNSELILELGGRATQGNTQVEGDDDSEQ
jgi:type II secretory pathway component PulC